MLERRSLKAPVALGVVLIVLVVVFAAIWILANLLVATQTETSRTVFWVFLAIGSVLLASILAGVIAYLTLTVKAFRLNQRQSNFIDSVTHELKSPIASLKLYLQTMTHRAVDIEQQQDFHRIMLEDVERLDSLINHLLDVARIDRGLDVADVQSIQLDQLLRQCGDAASVRYKLPRDTVSVDSPPVTVVTQLIQLEILFRNLIDNAVKYGGTPPKVIIRVVPDNNEQVVVSVIDNGPGIPANQRRKVFGRFVRLGNELERSTPGTGLGLYLVRTVSKAIGGSVRVRDRSETEGTDVTGTEFEVTLKGIVSEEPDNGATPTYEPPPDATY
ncbi:sensor histidine kinase [Planctomycetes bacterium K23_9]|uniref:histidine kinase n=1 Tax=Stieleria marina TaxID=1930275 RepID=A0A517NXN9_9BACT|nr:Alkaline phosphatase synthesis sensor protein PhoR [Planctomycetes bacterium K23_9]